MYEEEEYEEEEEEGEERVVGCFKTWVDAEKKRRRRREGMFQFFHEEVCVISDVCNSK